MIEHKEMVKKLVKCPSKICEEFNYVKADLTHAILGISGEAGEITDTIKKHVIYGQELDMDNLVEELGDMEFYLEQLRQCIGVTREECLTHNMKKLAVRYKNFQYSDKQAEDRADKKF